MTRHALALALVLLVTVALYARVTFAPLCSYDDFLEVHRAAFEDAAAPARVFTTPHFGTFRYRPFNRGLNLIAYRMGGGSALPFRARNLACHLVNVLLVAALAGRLLRDRGAGVLAAALFAWHPLADQTVIGSVMTNTAAHGLVLAALLCGMIALDDARASGWWMALGMLMVAASSLLYEAAIVFFPILVLYALRVMRRDGRRAIGAGRVLAFAAGTIAVLGLTFLLRARFVPHGFGAAASDHATPLAMARNLALYAGAMLAPLDPVLAHRVLGWPLPGQVAGLLPGDGLFRALVAPAVGALGVLTLVVLGWSRRDVAHRHDTDVAWFLAGAAVLSLGPVLVLSAHASETYVYLPLMFSSVLIAGALWRLRGASRAVAGTAAAALLLLALPATALRNDLVRTAALTAERILDALPATLTHGTWRVTLGNVAGETTVPRYGFYGFRGTDTIGATPHTDAAVTAALQLHFRNPSLTGRVLPAAALEAACAAAPPAGEVLAWVHGDGRVDPCGPEVRR